ncbi:hypothetical protein [Rubrivirga sp.]|uniref:hypothetical protein n=1 Tax=Rubrivirga sp. TaxID=1885344 RepID=UPI003B519CF8
MTAGTPLGLVLLWLALGAAGGALFVGVGRRRTGRAARVWWAGGLVVVTLAYVGFAVARSAPPLALAVEAVGVVAYGACAGLGLRGHRGWLAAGWLLHPLWDVGLHAGVALAPAWYVWACLGFDAVVGVSLYASAVRR